jgi:pyrimidine-specific ribonucleoside hydrolase
MDPGAMLPRTRGEQARNKSIAREVHMTRILFLVLISALAAPAAWCDEKPPQHANTEGRAFLILDHFPTAPEWYQPETAALIRDGVIDRYGIEEWVAIVLSHELHQHLGIYTIVGAKMGVRARELLEAPPRVVRVTLDTGGNGPMTCAADGIQASLASTFGQQLVTVEPLKEPKLAATFEYEDRKLRMTLNARSQKIIGEYIQTAIREHGNLTPEYFEAVEEISYTVWKDFDRGEVFDHEWLSAPPSSNDR